VKDKAAAIFEEAKKLWGKLSSRAPRAAIPAAIDITVETLERQVRQLEEEAAASYEVVNSIAQLHSHLTEQHLELAQALDHQLVINRRLTWACGALGVLVLVALALAIAR
jgi:predicted site-specific integrase-resolvase